jgi:uncharacterized protein (DUF58 family)
MAGSIILEQKTARAGAAAGTGSKRERLYIFPTRHGLMFAAMLAVMLVGAVNYTNSMAYMLTFMLGSLFMVAMLHTYRNLHGLIVTVGDAKPVFAGTTAQFPIIFDNRDGRARASIQIQPVLKWELFKRPADPVLETARIEECQLQRTSLAIPAPRRGHLKPGWLRLYSMYPLGLFRAWSYIDPAAACVVYPRPHGNPRLPGLTEDTTLDRAGTQAGTDDFTGFRQYRAGDSIRNIGWKILARGQGVLVKKFSGSGAKRLVLNWEQTSYLNDVEARLSQLTLWVLRAEQQDLRYGLELPGLSIEIDHGENHKHRCLRSLATYGEHKGEQPEL